MVRHKINVLTKQQTYRFIIGIFLFLFLLAPMLGFAQICSSDYHIHRTSHNNSFSQFINKKKGKVAFLGGSITYNPGWRDSVSQYLTKKFSDTDFEFIAAGIPSMGSTPGAFRLERDVLSKGPIDLLFVEAAVNDPTNGRSSLEQVRALEGIIRHARKTYPKIDIITMYFVDPGKMKSYNEGEIPEVIINHEKAADHYGVSTINLAREVTYRINAGEFTWEEDFKDLHPSPFGQMIYYHSIRSFLESSLNGKGSSNQKSKKHTMPEKLDAYSYDAGKLISINLANLIHGWSIIENWHPENGSTRAGYVDVPMLCAAEIGAELSLKFKGRAVGLAVAAGPDAGMIEYKVDDGPWEKVDLFTKWSSYLHLPWYYVLEAELAPARHIITIRIADNKNPESLGNACRIKHFFINE